jgi:hypothetical protein
MPPRYVLISNPGTKRCETYRRELAAFWAGRGAAADVEVVPWAEVAARDGRLDDLPGFDRPAVVRLESPGKDAHVTRLLLEAGARDDPAEPPRDWRSVDLPKGLLVRPGLQSRGFRRVLVGLRRSLDARPHLLPTSCPLAVAEMFDKAATCRTLAAAGVPTPDWIDGGTLPADPGTFAGAALAAGWASVYVKLNTGSCATGIVAVSCRGPGAPVGITTLAGAGGAYFNTRRLRRLVGRDELAGPFGYLRREGAIVQRGIPMAQLDGQNSDVRVVCVYGRPVATIFRLSSAPMTNLHLGGRRGDHARCRAAIPTRDWLDALDHCAEAAGCFEAAVAGVDLVFEPGYHRHHVLEVNAFGDFFPGWIDARGRSVHALEIEATADRVG